MIRQKLAYLDKWLLVPYMILLTLSIIMVYSASSYTEVANDGSPHSFLRKQALFVVMGIGLMFVSAMMNTKYWRDIRLIKIAAGVIFILLVGVLFTSPINGARRWIPLGFMNLQPAELAKFFTVWYFSYILSQKQHKTSEFKEFAQSMIAPTALLVVMAFIIWLQPDTGTPITIAVVSYTMVVMSGIPLKKGFIMGGIGAGLILSAYNLLYFFGHYIPGFSGSYGHARFLAVRYPFKLMQAEGLQLVNSYQALANGGLTGVGISESIQKTGYLPEAHTDFILSIIGEELGLVTIIGIIVCLMVIIGRIYIIGIRSQVSFYYFMCMGIGLLFFIQVCLNLGAVSGMLPITGVPFPFLSYGGSSLLMSSLSIGMVLNIRIRYRLSQQYQEGDA
ncbi:FtsW/RodA/SpoVE family cell cycle protein [Dolosigranulum savutiense]|uniref:Probable peptidoglycan glycosyltransferase FtsW n=1 Tax=Dolosigranulum savutiense TaxID=3110288 RepID=A0AB74TXH2_9LACT